MTAAAHDLPLSAMVIAADIAVKAAIIGCAFARS